MLVRESPKAKVSPSKNTANWPPKSPYEALLSSPSGRKKWEDRRNHAHYRSPSPSPMRRPMSSHKALQDLSLPSENEDDGEDEETLQLKLQAIEAKLKLKKLQQAKNKRVADDSDPASKARSDSGNTSPRKRIRLDESIQVPVSPIKERLAAPQNTSPARVLLGIDKGLRAQDVSLKRPKSGPGLTGMRQPDFLSKRTDTPVVKHKSFSERLAESRTTEREQQDKEERVQNARGRGFGLGSSSFGDNATPDASSRASQSYSSFKRPLDYQSTPASSSTALKATRTNSKSQSSSVPAQTRSSEPVVSQRAAAPRSSASQAEVPDPAPTTGARQKKTSKDSETTEASFDSYSALHLSRRHIEHTDLTRALSDKELYSLPRLLKEVKSPNYEPPDCESDYVVFGILASKSTPYDIKPKFSTSTRHASDDEDSAPKNKFMVLKLTDLNWEIDVFLFDTAFGAFWKLTPGTVVAILNPGIMPPKSHRESGKFSLKLTSSEETVLEIGTARDLGFCTSVKKDGQLCNEWINTRKSQNCDFHVNMALDKTRAGRMEVNGMFRYADRGDNDRKWGTKSRVLPPGAADKRPDPRRGRDAESGEFYFMSVGGSTAQMMDAEDKRQQARALEKRKKEESKEKELRMKLGSLGNGAGAEYLRANTAADVAATRVRAEAAGGPKQRLEDALHEKPDAEALGLVGNKANVRLSPVKRKRAFQASSTSSAGISAMGWGGANKHGLLPSRRAVSPEKGQGTLDVRAESPKKKARFALDKGIREPGRESLGDIKLSDDDDDLDIIR